MGLAASPLLGSPPLAAHKTRGFAARRVAHCVCAWDSALRASWGSAAIAASWDRARSRSRSRDSWLRHLVGSAAYAASWDRRLRRLMGGDFVASWECGLLSAWRLNHVDGVSEAGRLAACR